MTGPGGSLFTGKLPAVGDSRGEAKSGFAAVKHVHVVLFFQFPHPNRAFSFVGVVVRVLGLFQGVAEAPPRPPTLFKKWRKVRGEKFLVSCWRCVAVTCRSCWRLTRTAWATGASSVALRMGRRPCPAALARPARPPASQRLNPVHTVGRLTFKTALIAATSCPSALKSNY